MKQIAKKFVVSILGWQVRRLRKNNNFKIIAVVGSVGKTSTKFAIAKVLKQGKLVRFQEGNYNDIVSIPLVFFGHEMPNIINIFAWLKIFIANEKIVRKPYRYDVVLLELGTDGPGQIVTFTKYLHCDIAVVTAIAPEHMEFFKSLDDVAKEEFSVAEFSKELIVNSDLCDKKYYSKYKDITTTYGLHSKADNQIQNPKFSKNGSQFNINELNVTMDALGVGEIYSASAAFSVAKKLGLNDHQIKNGIKLLEPVNGRMKRLNGINGSLILDDTYNASPSATIAALETLYSLKAPQRIAVLGNMNELGKYSQASHEEVGLFCDPKKLDLVVTIGPDANKYLAAKAKSQGCRTEACDTPYEAAEKVKQNLKKKSVILAKGSQNGVFAEEAVKLLLQDKSDSDKLVRQSSYWMRQKERNFKK